MKEHEIGYNESKICFRGKQVTSLGSTDLVGYTALYGALAVSLNPDRLAECLML